MTIEQRITAFSKLGQQIQELQPEVLEPLTRKAANENNWFTPENVQMAFRGIATILDEKSLRHWTADYKFQSYKPKVIGIVMAGNVPMVGFHDLLCTLMAGHKAALKLSSHDQVLMKTLIDWLVEIAPEFRPQLEIRELLKNIDAVIATGSDNTSRYFEYYFRDIPHIIRKNRTSVAVLDGQESPEELQQLADDIFLYFGLGCRNVSKVYIPQGLDLTKVFPPLEKYAHLGDHHKFRNNYDYNKSIYLVNKVPHLDTGFSLWTESEELVSPISVIYYDTYESANELRSKLEKNESKIQCIISNSRNEHIGFGQAQLPGVADYADNVDTLDFLLKIPD